jgi:hypothetical protein
MCAIGACCAKCYPPKEAENQSLLNFWLTTQAKSHVVSSYTLSEVLEVGNRPGQRPSPPELCGTFASKLWSFKAGTFRRGYASLFQFETPSRGFAIALPQSSCHYWNLFSTLCPAIPWSWTPWTNALETCKSFFDILLSSEAAPMHKFCS